LLRKILIVLAVVVVIFVAVVATRPSEYTVTRSKAVNAPPAVVFAQVNDFHQWDAWSPWAKLDPNVKTTHSGAPAGTGAVYEWSGNKDVGKGKMTVTDSAPGQHVVIALEFIEPFASKADTRFEFAPEGQGTQVTWAMKGKMGFMEKAFGIFMNMDSMIGKDFEKGLTQLATVSQAEATKAAEAAAEAARAAQAAAEKAAAEAAAAEAAKAKAKPAAKKKR
jgi:carbon monoxide dehydrogenase subunit G